MVLLRPPDLLRCEPRFEGKNASKNQETVSVQGVPIVNHCAIVDLLRIVNLLRRSISSTAGSLGNGPFSGLNVGQCQTPT